MDVKDGRLGACRVTVAGSATEEEIVSSLARVQTQVP